MDPSPTTLDIHTQKPAAKTGAENSQGMGHPQRPLGQSPMPEPQNDPEFWPLSGESYFCAVLEKNHLKKMIIPSTLSEKLPAAPGLAKIFCRGKVWALSYQGASKRRFEGQVWEQFVRDNGLKIGDACVFELVESRSDDDAIQFKAQILKDDFPSELLENVQGFKEHNPISID